MKGLSQRNGRGGDEAVFSTAVIEAKTCPPRSFLVQLWQTTKWRLTGRGYGRPNGRSGRLHAPTHLRLWRACPPSTTSPGRSISNNEWPV